MNPMNFSWRLLKNNAAGEEPPAYHGDTPPLPLNTPEIGLFAPRQSRLEFDPNNRGGGYMGRVPSPQEWESWVAQRPDDVSQWSAKELDFAQHVAPSAEWHQRLSDERARRGVNIIPKRNMIDVGRDNEKNPMPPNRGESDWQDSVHGDFNQNIRDFQQKNAGEAMELAWRLLKMTPEEMEAQGFAEHAQKLREMQAEEQRIRQQSQAQAPKETPRVQQYNLQLAQRRAQEEFEQKLRRTRKESRGGRVDHLFPDIHAFHQEHGRLPKMPKNLKNRFLDYRARMEDE